MNLKIKYRESFRPFAPSVLTGCPVIVNLEDFILEKAAQPRAAVEDDSWKAELALD